MRVHHGIGSGEPGGNPDEETKRVQKQSTEQQRVGEGEPRQIAMFEKGKQRQRRTQISEDDSSEDGEEQHLVCNMIASKWESLFFQLLWIPGHVHRLCQIIGVIMHPYENHNHPSEVNSSGRPMARRFTIMGDESCP